MSISQLILAGAGTTSHPTMLRNNRLIFSLFPTLCLSLTLACGATDGTQSVTAVGASGAGAAGSGAAGGGSNGGNGGMSVSEAGAASGGAPLAANAGTGGVQSAGSSGATSGGASGSAGSSALAGAGGMGVTGHVPTGMSAGCNSTPPANDSSNNFVAHDVHINGLDAVYLPGGTYAQSSGNYTLAFRPYSVKLPTNYDPAKPYAVTFGGGGCGSDAAAFAASPGGNFTYAPNGVTIQVGLNSMTGCFNDGGPSIGNRTDSPEEPYFRAVVADIEAHYCVNQAQLFMAGYSSGGWEAYTLGCAASDLLRGIAADEGGMRTMHPACKGPVAAVLVAGDADTENPIGPLDPNNADDKIAIGRLGSLGSAPGRDDILTRNGCSGSASSAYTGSAGKYPQCKQYTNCPAAYPVIWCELPGVGHNSSSYNGVSYSPGAMWDVLGALPAP